jgi:hypothetical protein
LELRNRLGEFGPLARRASGILGNELAVQHAEEAFALLDVRLTRIDDADVIAEVMAWSRCIGSETG